MWSQVLSWPLWLWLTAGGLVAVLALVFIGELLVLAGLVVLVLGIIALFHPLRLVGVRLEGRLRATAFIVGGVALTLIGTGLVTAGSQELEPASTVAGGSAAEDSSTTSLSPVTTTTAPISTTIPHGDPVTSPPVVSGILPEGREVLVERVIDGDTIVVSGGERVRLIGIDTPETDQDECYAGEATQFVLGLVPPGTEVVLVADVEQTDRFGRTLAYLYRAEDGLFVNAEIVAQGYAQTLTIPPNVVHAEQFRKLAAQARDAELGLWSACLDRGEISDSTAMPVGDTDVTIVAINFDAPGNDNENKNGEWVRIGNLGDTDVDLGGWRLEDEGPNHVYRFPSGFVLSAGSEVVVYTGCGSDSAVELYWCKAGSAVWNNSGDVAWLYDSSGVLIDSRSG